MNSEILEFDGDDIKKYSSDDQEYLKLYTKDRYKNNTCERVECDVCEKSDIYVTIARHKKQLNVEKPKSHTSYRLMKD